MFGDYIDIYDMTQAVEDGATRPVYYESRVIHLKLDEKTLHLIDDEYDLMAENADLMLSKRAKRNLARWRQFWEADQTIRSLVDDILDHYENYRANILTGKGDDCCLLPPHRHEDIQADFGTASCLDGKGRSCHDAGQQRPRRVA